MERTNLGLTGCDSRICLHQLQHRRYPILRDADIGIKQDIIFSLNLFQRQVIAGGKTMVLIKSDNPDIREIFLKVVHRTVNRSIICHDDSSMVSAVFDNVGKKLLKEFLPVPVQYDDGCFQ